VSITGTATNGAGFRLFSDDDGRGAPESRRIFGGAGFPQDLDAAVDVHGREPESVANFGLLRFVGEPHRHAAEAEFRGLMSHVICYNLDYPAQE
jgi:hypothetical protein